MGCCSCFEFIRKSKRTSKPVSGPHSRFSQEFLLDSNIDEDRIFHNGEANNLRGEHEESRSCYNRSEKILAFRAQNGMICREHPVKETRNLICSLDENGNKMINNYVKEHKIGSGSYGKVVLYKSNLDGKHYAIKAFRKSHLSKLRVGPSETAMTDVLREVSIMKMLEHPNIVNLVEVIDDPNTDDFYMVLEYVEGKWVCGASGPLDEITARKYTRGMVAGLTYLHAHNIVHGDIKPDNLLITSSGELKIGDFSVSQAFEDDNDELRRSPGTPVFTAPECCLGLTHHGKAADTWALGVTLFCMVMDQYSFLGDTLQDTYDMIVNDTVSLPEAISSDLKNLLEGLLCKDPKQRMSLDAVSKHPWVIGEEGPIPHYKCWCKRSNRRDP